MTATMPPPPLRRNGAGRLLGRLLWPEQVAIEEWERSQARARLERAHAERRLGSLDAGSRIGALPHAATRADLRRLVGDLPDAMPPAGLITALRVVSVIWLVQSVVQFVVWLMIALFSLSLDVPWFLFSAVPGAVVVATLWWAVESYHRVRR